MPKRVLEFESETSDSTMKYKRPFKNVIYVLRMSLASTNIGRKYTQSNKKKAEKVKWKNTYQVFKKWLESPDSGGLTKVTIARSGQIFERVFEEKSISILENLLDENLIRDIWNQQGVGESNSRNILVLFAAPGGPLIPPPPPWVVKMSYKEHFGIGFKSFDSRDDKAIF